MNQSINHYFRGSLVCCMRALLICRRFYYYHCGGTSDGGLIVPSVVCVGVTCSLTLRLEEFLKTTMKIILAGFVVTRKK